MHIIKRPGFRKSFVVLGSLILLMNGCAVFARVHRYSDVQIKPDSNHIYVLTPAPTNVLAYDSSVGEHWQRTYNHCAQINRAIAIEIGQRESKISARKGLLLGLGGLASLANYIYLGVKTEPEKNITVPLSIIAGTALLSFIPSFSNDDQIPFLKSKIAKLNSLEMKSQIALMNLEKTLTEKALLDRENNAAKASKDDIKVKVIQEKIDDIIRQIDNSVSALSQALVEWSSETR